MEFLILIKIYCAIFFFFAVIAGIVWSQKKEGIDMSDQKKEKITVIGTIVYEHDRMLTGEWIKSYGEYTIKLKIKDLNGKMHYFYTDSVWYSHNFKKGDKVKVLLLGDDEFYKYVGFNTIGVSPIWKKMGNLKVLS